MPVESTSIHKKNEKMKRKQLKSREWLYERYVPGRPYLNMLAFYNDGSYYTAQVQYHVHSSLYPNLLLQECHQYRWEYILRYYHRTLRARVYSQFVALMSFGGHQRFSSAKWLSCISHAWVPQVFSPWLLRDKLGHSFLLLPSDI